MNKNLKLYKILHEETTDSLSQEVQEHLDAGWELQGGVAVDAAHGEPTMYMQALLSSGEPN